MDGPGTSFRDPAPESELRERRLQLGISLRRLAAQTGISYSFLSQIERGRRGVSPATGTRLRLALGLDAHTGSEPAAQAHDAADPERTLRTLASIVLSSGTISIGELATRSGAPIGAVRSSLPEVAERLAAAGVMMSLDGDHIRALAIEPRTASVGRQAMADSEAASMPGHSRRRQNRGDPVVPRLASPVLIGRDVELTTLLAAVTSPPAMVTIEGEAGIGKSRLVNELLDHRELRQARRLVGHCHALLEPFPLGPVIEAIRVLDDLPDARVFSPVVGALRPLIPELGEHLPPGLDPLGDTRAERHLLFRAVRSFLGRLGRTVLVIEDLQYADEGTSELLRFLEADLPPNLAVVATARIDDPALPSTLRELAIRRSSRIAGARVWLSALSPEEVRALIGAILDTTDVSQTLAGYVHERTAGIPFAVEEVVRLLSERRDLISAGGSWLRRSLDELAVPRTLRDSVLARTAQLSAEAHRIAVAAAVVGVAADARMLAKVAGLRQGAGSRGLRSCLLAGVLVTTADARYGFRHPLASQAMYEATPDDDRRAFHLRAARALETETPKPVAQLARHYRLAGQPRPWRTYAEAAADVASAQGDHAGAAAMLSEVIAAIGHVPAIDRVRLLLKLSTAALLGHAYQHEALAALRVVLDTQKMSTGTRGHLRSRVGLLLIDLGDASAGRDELAQAVVELRRRPAAAALAMVNLAMPMVVEGSEADHRRWLARAEAAAGRQRGRVVALTVEAASALIPVYFADPTAWARCTEFLDRPLHGEEQRQQLWLCAHLAGACHSIGHDARARSFLADADGHAAHLGWGRLRPMRDAAVLILDWAAGDWEGLETRALHLADELAVDYPAATVIGTTVAGSLALARGDLAAAEERLEVGCNAAVGAGVIAWLALASAALSRVHLTRGDPEAALAAADRGCDVLAAKGLWWWGADVFVAGVESRLAAGQTADASALMVRFAAGLRGRDAPLADAAVHVCRGMTAGASGRPQDAVAAFAAARDAYDRLPRPYAAATASARAGQRLLEGELQEEGSALLAGAMWTFERLAADGDAARVRRTLRLGGAPLPRRGGRRAYGIELSPREAEVIELAVRGQTTAEIAAYLAIAPRTVQHHLTAGGRKLAQAGSLPATGTQRVHVGANIARARH